MLSIFKIYLQIIQSQWRIKGGADWATARSPTI